MSASAPLGRSTSWAITTSCFEFEFEFDAAPAACGLILRQGAVYDAAARISTSDEDFEFGAHFVSF